TELVHAGEVAALGRRDEGLGDVVDVHRLEASLPVTWNRDDREVKAEAKPREEIVALAEEERGPQNDVWDAGSGDERLTAALAAEVWIWRRGIRTDGRHVNDTGDIRAARLLDHMSDTDDSHVGDFLLALCGDAHCVHDPAVAADS